MSFKFIPKILMSKECIHFLGPLCIDERQGVIYGSKIAFFFSHGSTDLWAWTFAEFLDHTQTHHSQ